MSTVVEQFVVTPEVVEYLKNFTEINPQIILNAGTKQRVCSAGRNVIVDVEFPVAIPKGCAIFELNKIVSAIGELTADKKLPTITFDETELTIEGSNMTATIPYAAEGSVKEPPTQDFPFVKTFASFTLSADAWTRLRRVAAVFNHDMLYVTIKNQQVTFKTVKGDGKGLDKNQYVIPNAQVFEESDTTWAIRLDAMKFLPGDYTVTIGNAQPSGTTANIFAAQFTLNDSARKVSYLTGGQVVKTR